MSAHRQGLVHGHLKPENVLFDDDGNVYLTHFGISSDVRPARGDGRKETSSPLTYLSPEQVRGEPATPWSDQYSLGLMIAEILTGQSPLVRSREAKSQVSGANPYIPTPREPQPDLPSGLDQVLEQATAPNPEDRYSDVVAFVTAFRQALGTFPATSNGRPDQPHVVISNPYKGLRPFRQADAADFFGREALTTQLLGRLSSSQEAGRFLAVVGPSGSGKSSVVKAGLLPALRQGAMPG
jgi:serine/threonine protein kinase